MTYEQNFEKIKKAFLANDASNVKQDLAFQFNITGEGEGIFYVKISDGKIEIEPYEYYDRDVIFIASADTFEKLGKGQLDPVLAYTVGKLKVDGPIEKALALKDLSIKKAAKATKPKAEKPAKATKEKAVKPKAAAKKAPAKKAEEKTTKK